MLPDTPLSLWTNHPMSKGGKMSGMWSWGNTNPLHNDFCTGCCSFGYHCYAKRFCKIRPNVAAAYKKNGEILSSRILPDQYLWAPLGSHRIQAFGEIINETHWANCVNLADNNPHAKFTIWTKRLDLILDSQYQPLKNMQIIASGDYKCNDRKSDYVPTFIVSKTPPNGKYITCKGQCVLCGYCYGWSRGAGLDPNIAIWELPR